MTCQNNTCNRPDLKPVMDGEKQFEKMGLLFYYCPNCKKTFTKRKMQ